MDAGHDKASKQAPEVADQVNVDMVSAAVVKFLPPTGAVVEGRTATSAEGVTSAAEMIVIEGLAATDAEGLTAPLD
jgi:hypothetical protein